MKKLLLICMTLFFQLFACVLMANPAHDLLNRLIPDQGDHFDFSIDKNLPKHTFKIESQNNKIKISGNDQSAINGGLGYYFRHVANIHLTDCGSTLTPPKKWPMVKTTIEKTTPSKIRTAYNYCTYCYTYTNYTWEEWQREIDRIALNGINVALVLPGHERVWQRTLQRLGMSKEDIEKFIPSSAFTAWWLMGNLQGTGGPISQEVIDSEAELGRKMCDRMRELGIEPIVNCFIGCVPSTLPKYVKAHYIPQGNWVSGFVRPWVLSPLDPEFKRIAAIWYEELHSQYGKINYYGGDLFHEGGNSGGLNLNKCGKAIAQTLEAVNPNYIYVMQCWQSNPPESLVQAFEPKHALVQQLSLDVSKLSYGRYRTYSNRPWVFTEIGNFGGNSGLYGNLKTQAEFAGKLFDKKHGNVIGMGLTAEGFRYNPIVYDLWADVMWSDTAIDLNAWIDGYITRRYGELNPKAQEAWKLLEKSVYNVQAPQESVTDFVMSAAPHKDRPRARFWCSNPFYWKLVDVLDAANALAQAETNTEGWRYDMIDVIRQAFNGYTLMLRDDIVKAYENKNEPLMEAKMAEFLEIYDDLDRLLASDTHYLLGVELVRAKSRSKDPKFVQKVAESHLLLYTIWDSAGGHTPLNDYASRSLAGLTKDYYKARWAYWFDEMKKAFKDGKQIPNYDVKKVDNTFYKTKKIYPTVATGNTGKIARELLKKYDAKIRKAAKKAQDFTGYPCELNPSQGINQVIKVDVTNDIRNAGKYRATIKWTSGNDALKISKVELFSGDKKVAEDMHNGYAGIRTEKNTYYFDLKKYRENLEAYSLHIYGEGDGGNQWRGITIFSEE